MLRLWISLRTYRATDRSFPVNQTMGKKTSFKALDAKWAQNYAQHSFFYVKTREKRHLRNGTSDHNFKILKTLFNTKYPPKPKKNHLRNLFWPLESVFFRPLPRAFSQKQLV